MPEADTIPQGLACASCTYSLAGLPWGTPCPECGYRAPTTTPTNALREAHPRFISATRTQLRNLIAADAIVLAGLALLALASITLASVPQLPRTARLIASIGVLGFPAVAAGLIYGLVVCVLISTRHRNARGTLDQPGRSGISKCFWWCVAPFAGSLVLALVTGGAAGCLVIIALPISLASAGVLFFNLFEHANSIVTRCGQNPSWSRLQYTTAYGSLACVLLTPLAFIGNRLALALLIIGAIGLLLLTHALRTRMAERCVRRVQAEIHAPPTET